MDAASALRNGVQLLNAGKFQEAANLFGKAAATHPKHPEIAHFLGMALARSGRTEEAEPHLTRAIELDPDNPKLITNTANFYNRIDAFAKALPLYRRAVQLAPEHGLAWAGLTSCLHELGETEEALDAGRRACALAPERPEAHINLSLVQLELGDAEAAGQTLRAGLAACPGDARLTVAMANCVNYLDSATLDEKGAAHRAIGEAIPQGDPPRLRANFQEGAKVRVGFLSPDFRRHSVAYFALPAIEGLDRDSFEVYLYSSGAGADEYTSRFRAAANRWRVVAGASDVAIRDQIASDRIDVVIDLGGHTRHSQLRALATRCATVQGTWIGYPNTTGLDAIDFRIVDSTTDPVGTLEYSSETRVRLDPCFLCYEPPVDAPPPRRTDRKHLVFGSFNNIAKVSPSTLRLWARALAAVPRSKLLLKAKGMQLPAAQQRIVQLLSAEGVPSDRVEFRPQTGNQAEHLAMYADVDVALDTVPYNGTTTTCEALWMGVPVLTQPGDCHAARVGASLLAAAGFPEWSADDGREFALFAESALPNRIDMRDRVAASTLCNREGFVQRLADALRACLNPPGTG